MRLNRSIVFPLGILAFTALLVAVFVWIGGINSKENTATDGIIYYPALADAFLSGQLHLKVIPDPRLKNLEKPWHLIPDGIPRLAEATYFKDRYYLYFSPVPALVLFIPFRLLCGVYPTDEFAVFIFTLATWAASVILQIWAWRRWFGSLPVAWLLLGLLLSAICTRTLLLLLEPMVQNVAVSCGASFGMLALLSAAWTLEQSKAFRQTTGLAVVSLTWALAVACRPNYLFSLPVLGVIWYHILSTESRTKRTSCLVIGRLTTAALMPAAMIGVGLLAYNHARFGELLEFGMTNQIGSIDQSAVPVFAWSNIPINWNLFVLQRPNAPVLSAYFPFFTGWQAYWGIIYATPSVILVFLLPWFLLRRNWSYDGVWNTFCLTLLTGFLLNFLSIMLLTLLVGQAERYVVDFLPWGVLLSILITYALLERAHRILNAYGRRALGATLALLCGVSLISSGLMVAMRSDLVERLPQLARVANRLVALAEGFRGMQHGPMTMRLTFQNFRVGDREPLLVAGHGRDIIFVEYLAADQIRLGLDHRDNAPLQSDPIPIEANREYVLDFDLGFLYPPAEHPFFATYPEAAAKALRSRLRICFDGKAVVDSGCDYYPTHPGDISVGYNNLHRTRRFSGTIVSTARPGRPSLESLATKTLHRHVRLTVELPRFRSIHSEPLLSLGSPGAGDLVYVTYLEPDKIRLGHDSYGLGVFESEVLRYSPETPTSIEIEVPSLQQDFDTTTPAMFMVRFADQFAIVTPRTFRPIKPYQVFLGFNGVRSSVVGPQFQGRIVRVESWDKPMLLPLSQVERGQGPLRLLLRLPAFSGVRSEPLLVTGETGAADALYVEYVDEHHVRFGYDHWGRGGPVSPPLHVDYAAINTVELSLGSLYPPINDAAWGNTPTYARTAAGHRIVLRLNGTTALSIEGTCHPAKPDQTKIGRNQVGLSTCTQDFTGEFVGAERLPFDYPALGADERL